MFLGTIYFRTCSKGFDFSFIKATNVVYLQLCSDIEWDSSHKISIRYLWHLILTEYP